MESTVLEKDDTTPRESNVAQESPVVESPEKDSTPETSEQPVKETQTEEPTVDLGEEKIPLSQVKKWKEDYSNDSKWRDKNRRESEALNEQKKRFAKLELIEPLLEQRPEILQQLFSPQQTKDFDKELEEHYARRNSLPVDPATGMIQLDKYLEWERQKDSLLRESAMQKARNEVDRELKEKQAVEHNNRMELEGRQKYLESNKVSESEFYEMMKFIRDNIRISDGKVPKHAFDVAFKTLYEDRWLSEIKIDTAKKAVEPIKKAGTVGDNGARNTKEAPVTQEDKEDDEFVRRLRG